MERRLTQFKRFKLTQVWRVEVLTQFKRFKVTQVWSLVEFKRFKVTQVWEAQFKRFKFALV